MSQHDWMYPWWKRAFRGAHNLARRLIGKRPAVTERLIAATRETFLQLKRDHPSERIYAFTLGSSFELWSMTATAYTEEGLDRVTAEHELNDDELDKVKGPGLFEASFDALAALDAEGLFGRGAERDKIVINVRFWDMSRERWIAHARRLNPPGAIANALKEMDVRVSSPGTAAWGEGWYQVSDLALSADRKTLGYVASGGGIAMVRLGERRVELFANEVGASLWGCAVSPDGSCLYAGGNGGVWAFTPRLPLLGLIPRRPGVREVAETEQASALAISPDGRTLAVSSWRGPVLLVDAASGAMRELPRHDRPERLAFNPAGKYVALAGADLAVFDVATGELVSSLPASSSEDLRAVAWSPDGTRIAVDWASERGIAIVSWPGLHQIASWRAVERCDDRPDLSEDDWTLDAVAWSPSGNRLAVCAGADLIVFDAIGGELSRANGAQEQLIACAFETDDIVHAVGRDVDGGPAVLTLNV